MAAGSFHSRRRLEVNQIYDYEKNRTLQPEERSAESKDLSKQNPDKAEKLEKKLIAWQKMMNARLPTPNPDYKK